MGNARKGPPEPTGTFRVWFCNRGFSEANRRNVGYWEPWSYVGGGADEDAAAEALARFLRSHGIHYVAVIYRDDDPAGWAWRKREHAKFCGDYTSLPWHREAWNTLGREEHYAHVSTEQGGMVAYTETPQKGVADRQTRVKAGRYLTKFFSDVLTPAEIETWANRLEAAVKGEEVVITTDTDVIEAVYEGGPESCMDGRHSWAYAPDRPAPPGIPGNHLYMKGPPMTKSARSSALDELIEILSWARPHGSETEAAFNKEFLDKIPGMQKDGFGIRSAPACG